MEKLILKWEKRSIEENVKELRASKIVPAVVYWHKQEPIKLKMNNSDFLRTYRVAWENHVITLELDGKKIDVLVHEVQRAPVSGDFLHIDFYAITKWEKVHTHIPLVFVWTSKAVSEWAILEELIKELEVKCLPTDLVDNFEVDLSLLENIWDNIKVSDLKVSSKIEILNHSEDVIAVASKARVEKEEETTTVEATTEEAKA
jgi:large subunit ribosomal protein L25